MRRASLVLALAALVAAGCGGSSNSSSGGGASGSGGSSTSTSSGGGGASSGSGGASSTVKLAADPSGQLKFTKSQLQAKAGKVTVDFTNTSPVPHDVVIAKGSQVLGKTKIFDGGTQSATVNLKPGSYVYYCSVPGHRQAGMQGTLTVK